MLAAVTGSYLTAGVDTRKTGRVMTRVATALS